ncbi:MAG: response regulator transcription factor [Candidatus Omnitrophica bacterium]|nr:response regulator transcription factor [Candidatus Omnitrophota bacterium]
MNKKILIVEDDVSILTGMTDLLTDEGYAVSAATSGPDGIAAHQQHPADLIILDIMIPEINGYEVCKQIRAKDPAVGIIMLTAKDKEIDKVVGLQLGADDYLTKPFGMNELLARINAVLRRREVMTFKPQSRAPIVFGDVIIDVARMTGTRGKKKFDVTKREVLLLQLFAAREGEVLDRDEILRDVWGYTYTGTTRTLDQHILKLRQKVEANPSQPVHILTVHGKGYRFVKSADSG